MLQEIAELTGNQNPPPRVRSGWRRAFAGTSVVVAMLVTGTAVLPFVLINTALRDRVLGSAANNSVLTATSESATGGWIAPLVFRNVRINDTDGRIVCTVREFRTSRGLLSWFTDPTHAGHVTVVEPHVEVHVGDDGKWPDCGERRPSDAQFSYAIVDGSFLMTVPWRTVPIVDLDALQITGNVGPDPAGRRMLTVDATQIFDHEQLSEAHTLQNLALVAPVLSQSTEVRGSASVWIDALQIPLDVTHGPASLFPIRGRVEFHSLEARLKQDWIRRLAAFTGQLTRTEIPDRIEVLNDSRVDFVLTDDGVSHQSMVFLLPQIAEQLTLESSGMIHFDESLDMRLTVTMPPVVTANQPLLALLGQLSGEPLQLQVRGTVSEPQLQFPDDASLLSEISRRVAPAQHAETAPSLPAAITDLLQDAGSADKDEARKNLPGNVLKMIRAVDQARKNKAERRRERTR